MHVFNDVFPVDPEQIAKLKTTVAELKSVLEKQAAAIEKVDARIRADQTNPQFVSANP